MRPTDERNGVHARAFQGTTGVLLGIDVDEDKRDGLLGFAIHRTDLKTRRKKYLSNMLVFPGQPHEPGQHHPSDEAPLQRFRWSDYTTRTGRKYRYEIHPVRGTPAKLKLEKGPVLRVATAEVGRTHTVMFNRAAAASQAFSRQFPDIAAEMKEAKLELEQYELRCDALKWLSRGLLETLLAFIREAGAGWGLDIAIYEYELPDIVEAVEAARGRGADVRVVYHGKKNDQATKENEHALAGLPSECKRARLTSAIFHHKFIVLSRIVRGKRQPKAVLCGSTNFTENGVYRQANVIHILRDTEVAGEYLRLFDQLFSGVSARDIKAWIDNGNPLEPRGEVFAGFSPRTGRKDLDEFAKIIQGAKRDVIFATAFSLDKTIKNALLGEPNDDILRYGVQDKADEEMKVIKTDRTRSFTAAARLDGGIEGWLKETTAGQRGSILIHCKLIIVDGTGDAPIIISGSHNLSGAASSKNDENWLTLATGPDVADRYTVEAMRIYDHYRFRSYVRAVRRKTDKPIPGAGALRTTSEWTDQYFPGGEPLENLDRRLFSGR